MSKEEIISKLEALQKYYPNAGCAHDCPSIDWDEDEYGDWVKAEDIEELVKELRGTQSKSMFTILTPEEVESKRPSCYNYIV